MYPVSQRDPQRLIRCIAQLAMLLASAITLQVAAATSDWQRVIDRVSSGVVAIRVDHVRAFDEKWNQSTDATGFVVDKEEGIILTNRHVVGPGPATAQAVFLNQEEVDLIPIYRDPVHDFGFFKYDPASLRYIDPEQLELAPDAAEVGLDIRIVGNDAGEQLSVLDGTISRLDRPAPAYGRGRYNDFNTFYLQAASSTSGGSSGSPVVNSRGQVIALNAGARSKAATSFFLPLRQVARALQLLREGRQISRGTLETTFQMEPYADLRKLGLTDATEARFRESHPETSGLLVVEHKLPGNDQFMIGDILLEIDGSPIASFADLAEILDSNVGSTLAITLQRAGSAVTVNKRIKDLHALTPTRYLEIDGGILHSLSYQRARHYNRAIGGVYLADPGFTWEQSGMRKGALITRYDGRNVESLEDLKQAIIASGYGKLVEVRYLTQNNVNVERVARLRIDHQWFPSRDCDDPDATGIWQCRDLVIPAYEEPPQPLPELSQRGPEISTSLVHVTFRSPYPVSAIPAGKRSGTGIVVDAEAGTVLTSRTIVGSTVGNVRLTFGGIVDIAATIEHVHPTHNLVLLSYDPAEVVGLGVRSARLRPEAFEPGKTYTIAGLDNEQKVKSQPAVYTGIEAFHFPVSAPPQFQNENTELLKFVNGPSNYTGVILNAQSNVVGLWQRYVSVINKRTQNWSRGTHLNVALAFMRGAEQADPWFDLGAGWYPTTFAGVRKQGLEPALLSSLYQKEARLYEIHRLTHGTAAWKKLQLGDVLLKIEDQPILGLQTLQADYQTDQVDLKVFRDGEISDITVRTQALETRGLKQIVLWSGAVIQPIPRTLAQERQLPLDGVYVSYYRYGSPASRAGLSANLRITAVDEVPVHDMQAFLREIATKADNDVVRLRTLDLNNRAEVVTLRMDQRYWPTYTLKRVERSWQLQPLPPGLKYQDALSSCAADCMSSLSRHAG